jgi:hypothetical protein
VRSPATERWPIISDAWEEAIVCFQFCRFFAVRLIVAVILESGDFDRFAAECDSFAFIFGVYRPRFVFSTVCFKEKQWLRDVVYVRSNLPKEIENGFLPSDSCNLLRIISNGFNGVKVNEFLTS